jgi:hypothetical protein
MLGALVTILTSESSCHELFVLITLFNFLFQEFSAWGVHQLSAIQPDDGIAILRPSDLSGMLFAWYCSFE